MLAALYSGTTKGLEGVLIEVEVDVAQRGFPTFTIVGLPNKAVDEAKERVRAAIINTSFDMPDSRITVNLAPADIPKEGSQFDLPIAVGILAASGMVNKQECANSLFIGELSLEGNIRGAHGVISLVLMAKEKGLFTIYVPRENAQEAALVDGVIVYAVSTLGDLVLHLNRDKILPRQPYTSIEDLFSETQAEFNFSDIQGQEHAKRAFEIAAAGFHNIHVKGPPGAGKTMLSRAFPSLFPPLDKRESLEILKIHSIAGLINASKFRIRRPFRAPHHTISRVGLIGGGSNLRPGEISLAHRGVLFLDEFPEFPRSVLEALRQPMEDGTVHITRASGTSHFPSRFLLVAASNPCPCGYLGHPKKSCKCMPGAIARYRKRLSGPILDRIDLHVNAPPVESAKLRSHTKGESSKNIQKRVVGARKRQKKRLQNTKVHTNGEMNTAHIKAFCKINPDAEELLGQAVSKLSLSARSFYKIIKISQTISDLSGEDNISSSHIAEALQYRMAEE